MHVIFGISALVMLAGTIWMLAKDHNRQWRKWQLDDRSREQATFFRSETGDAWHRPYEDVVQTRSAWHRPCSADSRIWKRGRV